MSTPQPGRDELVTRLRAVIEWVSERDHGQAVELDRVVWQIETLSADHRTEVRVETAAQVLHDRRHRAGTAHTCDRCREDAAAVAAVFTATHTEEKP